MLLYCAESRRAPFVAVFRRSAETHGFDVCLTNPPAVPSAAFAKFQSSYRHLSVNPPGFELACFRRYFAAQADLAGKSSFVMSDSDIFVQGPWRAFPEPVRDAGCFVGSVGETPKGPEDDISPHFSVWTPVRLADFIDFLIFQYTERIDELQALYARRSAMTARPSISDMTLLHLWGHARNLKVLNSNVVQSDGSYMDHNVSTPLASNARFRENFGRKQLVLRDGLWHLRTIEGAWVYPLTLHLQGRYKLAAEPLLARQHGKLYAVSTYISLGRIARRLIQRGHAVV
jgi:hypothetical protein